MDRKVTFTGANKVLLAFTIIFMAFQFLMIIPVAFWGEDFISRNMYNILLINEYIIILVPVAVYTIKQRLDVKKVFRLKNPGLLPSVIITLTAIPAMFAAGMLNSILSYFLQFLGNIPVSPLKMPDNVQGLFFAIFVIGVSPGICEELLHRGIMLSGYERRGSMRAIAFTAIMFGVFHFDVTNLLGPILLGLIIGYYVIRTDSIFAGILAHFLNNTISVLLQYFSGPQTEQKILKITNQDLAGALVYGIAGCILTAVLLYWFTRVTKRRSVMRPPVATVAKDIWAVFSYWPVIIILSVYMFTLLMTVVAGMISKFAGG